MKNYEKIAFGSIGIIRWISVVTSPFVKLLTATTNAISKIFGVKETEEELQIIGESLYKQTTAQVVVVTVESLDGYDVEEFIKEYDKLNKLL